MEQAASGQATALSSLLSQGFYAARGMVITPPALSSWKGKDGNQMHMLKQTVVCGLVSVVLMDIGDTAEDFPKLQVGQMVHINVRSSKTEKGLIQVSGDVEILDPQNL